MRDETELENARLGQLEERLRIETAYANKLEDFVRLKTRQSETLARITDPQLRAMIAAELGLADESQQSSPRGIVRPYQRAGVLD